MSILKIGNKNFELGKQTIIMGILNVTPDSFSDGSKFFSTKDAVKQAIRMEKEGADIIDIGGESTRPGAANITKEEEIKRVIPVIKELVDKISIPLSIDTYKSDIAEKALNLGAGMVNDVTSFQGDKKLVNIVAKYKVPVCLMHMKGKPSNMQKNPVYNDVVEEIKCFFKERTEYAMLNGIERENIIIDPGLGFGKRTGKGIEDNCEILSRLSELKDLGFPIMIGASRKTFIGNVCGNDKPLQVTDRLEGSLAAACIAIANGADIVRVHDVKETCRCVALADRVVR
jgi:dihydropteroate synthase